VTTSRLTRPQQVERNRDRVLVAARKVFGESGYAKASLDAIAERAGFSKGVVYSQFDSKADLFLALLEQRIAARAAQNSAAAEEPDPAAALAALLRTADPRTREERDWQRVLIEFRAQASYDRALTRRYAALHERTVEQLATVLAALCGRAGVDPGVAPRTLAEFVLAVGNGATLEHAASSRALPTAELIPLVTRALGLDRSTP
jgi:AcrR family transcriptional regulator